MYPLGLEAGLHGAVVAVPKKGHVTRAEDHN